MWTNLYKMGTSRKNERVGRKTQNRCEYCGKLCCNSTHDFIHKKCAISYLESQGYAIIDFNLKRVLFGEEKDGSS